jgi:hypothetical protein
VAGLSTAPVTVLGRQGTKKSIVILARGDQADKSVEVSKRWYNHVQHVSKVRDALERDLRSRSNVTSVGIQTGDKEVGDIRSHVVRVNIEQNTSREGIPKERNGVPVRITEHGRSKQTSRCYTVDDQKVHGGLSGWGDLSSDNNKIEEGTLCCRVYLDGNKRLMTCRHLFNGDNCKDGDVDGGTVVGDTCGTFDQHGDTMSIGKVTNAYQKYDMALVDTSYTDHSLVYDIAGESDGGIVGRVTGDGLQYMMSNDTTVHKRSLTTCHKYGDIKTIQETRRPCGSLFGKDGFVTSTPTQKDKDSGSPVYYKEVRHDKPDLMYLAHMATRATNGNALGVSANKFNKDLGITYGSNPYSGN